jgi:hypothetical protein
VDLLPMIATRLQREKLMKVSLIACALLLAGLLGAGSQSWAQRPAATPATPPTPKADSPIDLTGYWVSIVNEDWRWRMLTPPKGDYASVPLNDEGRKVADSWELSQDGSCKAFGAGGIMRMPTRVHISWASDNALKLETDAGEQTRMFYFRAQDLPPAGTRSLQGRSLALWEHPLPPATGMGGLNTRAGPQPGGDLKVVTTDLAPGWLRRNGVPYSEHAEVTEYYDRFPTPDGNEWFVVTTVVHDPMYLRGIGDFVTSSHFRREPDGAKWHPKPCKG